MILDPCCWGHGQCPVGIYPGSMVMSCAVGWVWYPVVHDAQGENDGGAKSLFVFDDLRLTVTPKAELTLVSQWYVAPVAPLFDHAANC